ncbi:MAG: putative RuBisCO transcriptional regulator-like [Bradyrhizobium sp.]|nr:putative RuBisCO transcriptional regulator-like [Bradyrhizobium sp.]
MDLRQLRYAVNAADAGSFLAAAKKLRVKHMTLSRRITQLEERLGLRLFERSHRGVVPTRAGVEFLASARRIIEDVDRLQLSAGATGRGEAGSIAVGFNTSLSAGHLRTIMLDFDNRFPGVDLQAVEAGGDRLSRDLASRAIDIAIVFGPIDGDDIRKRFLWSERLLVALRADHPLAAQERIYWHDLQRETFAFMREDPGPAVANIVRAALTEPGVEPNILLREISSENILNLVGGGLFATAVFGTAAGLHHPGVVLCEIQGEIGKVHVDFFAYWRKDNDNSALQRFLTLIAERHPDASAAHRAVP